MFPLLLTLFVDNLCPEETSDIMNDVFHKESNTGLISEQ